MPHYGSSQPLYQPVDSQQMAQLGGRPGHYSSSSMPSIKDIDDAYGYSPRQSAVPPRSAASRKRLFWGIGIAVLALVIIGAVVGAVVGVTQSNNNRGAATRVATGGNSTGAAPSASSDPGVVSGGTTSGSGDASFQLDARLHKSFYAMAYTPPNAAYYPNCGDTIEGVVKDIQLISQLTTRIRLYGADCNQSALVLDAIQRTQTNLSVYLGVYMDVQDPTIYQRQLSATMDVLRTFRPTNVLGITVGNEILLQAQSAGRSVTQAQADVIANMASVKTAVQGMGLNIPVGSGDAGSMITLAYASACDFIFSNNHPFFSGVGIAGAAQWTVNYMLTDTPSIALQAPNRPTLIQGEVGWPTDATPGGSLSLNGSAASIANSQTFLDTWVCQSNANRTQYVYFEAFDEAWKSIYNGSEPFWGLMDDKRVLKSGLTIPTCLVDY